MKKLTKILLTVSFLLFSSTLIYAWNNSRLSVEGEISPQEKLFSSVEFIDNSPVGVFKSAWRTVKNDYVDKTNNHQDWRRWIIRYEKKIKTKDDAYLAINSMIESLDDPYSRFLPPDEFREQTRNIDATLFGVGVHISEYKGHVVIVNVIEGSPAEKFGLKTGDRILKVDGNSVKGLSVKEVADAVRGPAKTKVVLIVLRSGKELRKEIVRGEIKIKAVKHEIMKDSKYRSKKSGHKFGYIRISTFISEDAATEFLNALRSTHNTDGLIIDLRGNHGGLLPNAIMIANMLLERGTIVSVINRNGKKKSFNAEPDKQATSKPIVIIINKESASASEILAGALKDNQRASLVGQTTFGKGLVQRIIRLQDGSGINLTIAKYHTPNGTDINKKGIEPDYPVEIKRKDILEGRDLQLEKAKQILSSEIELGDLKIKY